MRGTAGLTLLFLCLTAAPATAQEVVTDPEYITQCQCGQQRVDQVYAEMMAEKARFDDSKARVTALDAEIAETKPTVNVDDPEQVDAFRRLIATRERAYGETYTIEASRMAELVDRYNHAVGRYSGLCGGQRFDADVEAQVRARLVCPVEQDPSAPQSPR